MSRELEMLEPKITFDVDVKRNIRGVSEFYKYIDMLDEHENVKLEFAETKDAIRVQKGIYMLLGRQRRCDIVPMRRKNIIYLFKEEEKN